MDKKSSGGGGQGSGNPKQPQIKLPARKPHLFEGGGTKDPRATINALAATAMASAAPKVNPEAAKKQLQANVFSAGTTANERKAKLPNAWNGPLRDARDEAPEVTYDGSNPAEEVTSRDVWRAILPPVVSREDRRSPDIYRQVIHQFAVGHNPRYEPDAPDKPRAHIFVWDVTRAMNAEIPHMLGARELTLAQTVDWLRYEGSQRGWVKVSSAASALEAAQAGKPVVVVPKQGVSKMALLAIVQPDPPGPKGLPRVAAAAKVRGNDLNPEDALGVFAFEFFVHP